MGFPSFFLFPKSLLGKDQPMMLKKEDKAWLADCFGEAVQFNAPMAKYTSLGVGGPVDVLVFPTRISLLSKLFDFCSRREIPYDIIGAGTNLLVKDTGVAGVIVSLKALSKKIAVTTGGDENGFIVEATAGVKTAALCRFALEKGFAGFNFAVGIPGTVGGAIAMNAGTGGRSMADIIESVEVLLPDGLRRNYPRKKLSFSYRGFGLDGPDRVSGREAIILSGRFSTEHADRRALQVDAKQKQEARRRTQPVGWGNAGCFYKNPEGEMSAGALIEMAGLKGRAVGNAQVSKKHANFLVNTGGATANEFITLMAEIEKTVSQTFGIDLEPEVKIIGT